MAWSIRLAGRKGGLLWCSLLLICIPSGSLPHAAGRGPIPRLEVSLHPILDKPLPYAGSVTTEFFLPGR